MRWLIGVAVRSQTKSMGSALDAPVDVVMYGRMPPSGSSDGGPPLPPPAT